MTTYLLQALNGAAYASVLYLLAVGLSLTFGVGRFLNLAHGGFYVLGGYLGLTITAATGNPWLALVVAPLAAAVLGFVVERLLLRRLAGAGRELEQVLVTFGLAFVLSDLMRAVFGARIRSARPPAALAGSIDLGGVGFSVYRLVVIAVGALTALALAAILRRTPVGVRIRAAAADAATARTLGVRTSRVLSGTFCAGVALAAFGGVLGAPILALAPGLDFTLLITALIVIVVGGLGNVTSTYWSALLVGMVDVFGKLLLPGAAIFLVYVLMAGVLVLRPHGLFSPAVHARAG